MHEKKGICEEVYHLSSGADGKWRVTGDTTMNGAHVARVIK